jgi:hypothetical protein
MGAETAIIASVLAAGTQADTARRSRKQATAQANKTMQEQEKAMAQEKKRQQKMDLKSQRDADLARIRAGAQQVGGRQSTILTGSNQASDVLGVGAVGAGQKTILGS